MNRTEDNTMTTEPQNTRQATIEEWADHVGRVHERSPFAALAIRDHASEYVDRDGVVWIRPPAWPPTNEPMRMGCDVVTKAAPTSKKHALGLLVRSNDDAANDRTVHAIMSSGAIDSYGEIVDQTSWKLDRFKANPVVLWGHNANEPPIGRAENVRVEGGALRGSIVFATGTARAEECHTLVQQGMLGAVSVGFRPGRVTSEKRGDTAIVVLSDCELCEVSIVSMPANPEALISHAKAMGLEPLARAAPIEEDRDSLIARGIAERKLTPATKVWAMTAPLEAVRAFVSTAYPAAPPPPPPVDARAWGDFTRGELVDLAASDPDRFRRLADAKRARDASPVRHADESPGEHAHRVSKINHADYQARLRGFRS